MSKLTTTVIALVFLLAIAGIANAAAFQNGSFEIINAGSGTNWEAFYAGSTSITGWTVVPQDPGSPYPETNGVRRGSDYWVDPNGWFHPVPDGLWIIAVGNGWGGGIEQTFDTIAGHQYQVDVAASANPWGGSNTTNLLRLRAPGLDTNFLVTDGGHGTGNMVWQQKSATFTAAGAQSNINFETADPFFDGLGYPFIDNVRVTDMGAVPEPSALLALGSCLAGFAGLTVRRKK